VRVANVTIDTTDAPRIARFWAELLGREVVFEEGPYVVLGRREKAEPNLIFQNVPDPTPGKSRAHLDLHVEDLDAAVARAESLGATRDQTVNELGMTWVVMRDPDGNPFCLAAGG
jgi:catechol 2,3-dioxygenase-like lactoylglutathione lyase family enzyme